MCGRVYQNLGVRQLLRLAGTNLINNQQNHQTSYNVCPSTYIPAIKHANSPENNNRQLDMVKWGYYAPFGQYIVNARVEEASEKRTYKSLINTSRAVMICEGYFEWTPAKEPFVFRPKETNEPDKPPCIYIAGLIAPNGNFILFTRESIKGYSEVHHRMPVILSEDEINMWLDCNTYKFEKILFNEILNEKKEKWANVYNYRISNLINSNKENSSRLLLSIKEYEKEQDKIGIKKFFSAQPKKKENPPVQNKDKEKAPSLCDKDVRASQSTQATQFSVFNNHFEEEKLRDDKITAQDINTGYPGRILTDEERAMEHDRLMAQALALQSIRPTEEVSIDLIQESLDRSGLSSPYKNFDLDRFNHERSGGMDVIQTEKESKKRRLPADGGMLVNDLQKQSKQFINLS